MANNRCFGRMTVYTITCLTFSAIVWAYILIDKHVKRPRVPQFQVNSFSISNFTATPRVSFAADVGLTARNTDGKHALTSGRVDAGVYYMSSLLATAVLPPFSLGQKGQGPLIVSFPAVAAGNFMERDQSVRFDLKMSFFVGFQKSRDIFVDVFCADLLVPNPSNAGGRPGPPGGGGGLIGGPRPCRSR